MIFLMASEVSVQSQKHVNIQECIQKFPDWLHGAKTANGTALSH